MITVRLKSIALFAALALAGAHFAANLFANGISSVNVEPTLECAGVIVKLSGTDDPGTATLEVKGPGETAYRRAHDFTRYDNAHLASSLFDLKPGTTYAVRVTLNGQTAENTFTTRPEFVLPAPLRTVRVANTAQLQAAIDNARPGDEILLARGTYAGGLTVAKSGTAARPIVIRGDVPAAELSKPADKRAGLPVINGTGHSPVITVTGTRVVLDGLRLENVSLLGISLEQTNHGVIQNCQITGASSRWNHFIYVNGGGRDGGRHLIQDNYLQDTGTGFGYGILQDKYPGPGTVIRRNILTGFFDSINPSGNEGELNDENLPETHPDVLAVWPNHSTDVYENEIRISRDDDIEMDGIAVNTRVFRNRLSAGAGDRTTNGISIAPIAPGPFFFVGNVITNFTEGAIKYNTASYRGTIRNCYFYHNTIKNDLGTAQRGTLLTLFEGTGYPGTPSKNTRFKNNVFVGDRMLVLRRITVHTPDYNPNYWYSRQASGTLYQWDINGPSYDTFDAWREATGQEAGGHYGDPRVDDATFRLAADSPAIDKGVRIPGINDTYAGSAPDMGAFEYGAAGLTTDTPLPGENTYAISGSVKDAEAAAIAGARVRLNGTAELATLSDENGFYRFAGLPDGSYTVTIEKPGYTFSPGSTAVAQLGADRSGVDFTGAGSGAPETLDAAYGFPSPWRSGDAPYVTFWNLTPGTLVRVFTMSGDLVTELREPENAEIRWDVSGVASGVYLCVLTDEQGGKKTLKIAVIK